MMVKAIGPQQIRKLLDAHFVTVSRIAAPTPNRPDVSSQIPEVLRDKIFISDDPITLRIIARNSAVAQVLRFHLPAIARISGYADWKISVGPLPADALDPNSHTAPKGPPPPQLSPYGARCLREAATGIADEGLRRAMIRLAENAKPE